MALSLSWDIRPGKRGWAVPLDVWMLVNGAEYVAAGALGYMYETRVGPALPLFHILLAPAAWAGYELGLTKSDPRFIAYPTMWLLVGPYAMAFAVPVLGWARRLGHVLSGREGLLGLQVAIAVLGVGPAFFQGHFEDGLALGLLMLAVSLRLTGRLNESALALAFAIASKQWAFMALPIVALGYGPAFKARQWLLALSVPLSLMGFVLAVDWAHAAPALFDAPTYPELGRLAPWAESGSRVLVTTPFRAALVIAPLAVGLWLYRRAGTVGLINGVALVLWSRALLEPVLHAYYLAPGIAFLLMAQRLSGGRLAPIAAGGAALIVFFGQHPTTWLWWAIFYVSWAVLAAPPVSRLVRAQRGQDGRNSSSAGRVSHDACS